METRSRNVPAEANDDANSGDVPSGFILKLYQMVNGAPDDVISWTPAGDAFIIGSDLKRLESETLPQYFRHNRFQSLVRQLNFYSFRKINRERNVWIYKHELFHRDRPEDLHMVRRRTCPGLDGRKQRFSRFSARKLTDNSGSDEDSSSEELSLPVTAPNDEHDALVGGTKRSMDEESEGEASKKSRRLLLPENVDILPKQHETIDMSLLVEATPEIKEEKETEEPRAKSPLNERAEMAERSLIVSEVAKKLEKFARKAYGPIINGKGKRNSSGVVTPPFGTTVTLRTTNLLTYDDEFGGGKDVAANTGVVTDGDESTSSGEDESRTQTIPVSPNSKNFCSTPAGDMHIAREISNRLLGLPTENREAKAAVASFCIMNTPHGDNDIGSKILQLIASCENLAAWFNSYRTALNPFAVSEKEGIVGSHSKQAIDEDKAMQQHWAQEASRLKAIHDFTVFAVNCVNGILGEGAVGHESTSFLTKKDEIVLERAILLWSKNVK
ncbi:hypothetical protein ACA910_010657 [Epithemia clementina (nom. ined.)]